MEKFIITEIKNYLSNTHGVDECSLREKFNNDLGFDSLDTAELMQWIVFRFKVPLNTSQEENITTLKQLVDHVRHRVEKCECISLTEKINCRKYCFV